MSSILGFPFMLAKSMLLFPLHLLLGSFKREKPGAGAGGGVWAASGPRGGVYMGRLGILPSMLIMAVVTLFVITLFVAAGAVLLVLSPVLIARKLLPRPARPVLDDSIPTTGRIQSDEPDAYLPPPQDRKRNAGL